MERQQPSSPGFGAPVRPDFGTGVGSNAQTVERPTARSYVGEGSDLPPFNTTTVTPYEPTADSATVDPYTGIMDYGKLSKLRERAVYNINSLSYAPLASGGTGVLFPDAVRAKVEVESALRARPTTFKGPQQLDVAEEDGDVHINRQMHPAGTNISNSTWYLDRDDGAPFRGFPNPDLFYMAPSVNTHNTQNITHAQMTELMRRTGGDYEHMNYLQTVGSLLKSDALDGPEHPTAEEIVPSDGGGVNADPRMLEKMYEEYERDFQLSKRIRVADATNDPRFRESAPGVAYTREQHALREAQEDQFSRVAQFTGFGTSYTQPHKVHVGQN
jgi:hypothetical protein